MGLTRINNQALTNVTSAGLPSGSVLQTVTKTLTTQTNYTTRDSWVDVGLKVDITPKKANSKFLIHVTVHASAGSPIHGPDWTPHWKIFRGTSDLSALGADTSNNRLQCHIGSIDTLDSNGTASHSVTVMDEPSSAPAGTTITYNCKGQVGRDDTTWGVNRGGVMYNDNISGSNPVSTITVQEIAG